MFTYMCVLRPQVSTDNLAKIANSFEFSRENYEPLVQTCMTTLSSKV